MSNCVAPPYSTSSPSSEQTLRLRTTDKIYLNYNDKVTGFTFQGSRVSVLAIWELDNLTLKRSILYA